MRELLIASLLVLAACGSDDGDAGGTDWTPESALQQLVDEGLCDTSFEAGDDTADTIEVDFDIESEWLCESDVGEVSAVQASSGAALDAMVATAIAMSEAFGQDVSGIEVLKVSDDMIVGSNEDEIDDATGDWLRKAQGVLGGDIVSLGDL